MSLPPIPPSRRRLASSALLSVLLMSACGGGGSSEPTPEPPPTGSSPSALDLDQPTVHDIDATNHTVPFGNGTGVHIADDGRVLAAYTVDQRVRILTVRPGGSPVTTTLPQFSFGMALGADGEVAVLLTTQPSQPSSPRRMMALASSDFGTTWSAPVDVGDAALGATVPAACVWHDASGARALVAWVAPPGPEDGGPMYVASWTAATGWSSGVRVGSGQTYTAPTLACSASRQELVARNDLPGDRNEIVRFVRDASGGWTDDGVIVQQGADPHYCVAGDDAWVGYHVTGSAMAGHSRGGAPFTARELDDTGKFVPMACFTGGHAVACNGDWDTKADAEAKATNRRILCHATHDAGASWTSFSPAPGQTQQNVTSVKLSAGGLAIFWQQPSGVRLATYRWRQ